MSTVQPTTGREPETAPDINIPQPPMCTKHAGNTVHADEPIVLTWMDGSKLHGNIKEFDIQHGTVRVVDDQADSYQEIDLSSIKLLSLPEPKQWVPVASPESRHAGLELPSDKQQFAVTFRDGDVLEGETRGFRSDKYGIYIFPVQSASHYMHTFIPHTAMEAHQIGPMIGEVLVKQNLLSEEQLDNVLSSQQDERNKLIGEYLRNKAVVTTNELENALQRQQSAPNVRLGEILIGEGLITDQMLGDALEIQKTKRKLPLGEIFVQQGLLTRSQIQKSLATKLGIPFVDLHKFQLDMDAVQLVPENLVRKYKLVPLYYFDSRLVVALINPMDWEALESVRFHTNLYVEPVMADEEEIERTINLLYASDGLENVDLEEFDIETEEDEDIKDLESAVSDNVVVKLVNKIVVDAYHQNASDIHIEPSGGKKKTVIRLRKDGTLVPYYEVPSRLRAALVARIKVMSGLDISERRKPQDGKIDFKRFGPLKIELRVATLPTVGNQEDVVMRVMAGGEPIPVTGLGLNQENRDQLISLIEKPYGIFFVCGPTGSGKTTTLHSLLSHLNTPESKIWTAEDPVEITQKGLRQLQVNPKIGVTFASAMRSFLRADPDIIMVGEMRDQETTKIGIEASLTGHLVLSTLHTNSAPESVTRLLDLGMDPFSFADSLLGVLAQRLAKTLCPSCKRSHTATEKEIETLLAEYCHEIKASGGTRKAMTTLHKETLKEWKAMYASKKGKFTLYKPDGCEACDGTGYRGRIGIHELLVASDAIKEHIHNRSTVRTILATAMKEGMRTLRQDGIEKILQGHTDIYQIHKVCIK